MLDLDLPAVPTDPSLDATRGDRRGGRLVERGPLVGVQEGSQGGRIVEQLLGVVPGQRRDGRAEVGEPGHGKEVDAEDEVGHVLGEQADLIADLSQLGDVAGQRQHVGDRAIGGQLGRQPHQQRAPAVEAREVEVDLPAGADDLGRRRQVRLGEGRWDLLDLVDVATDEAEPIAPVDLCDRAVQVLDATRRVEAHDAVGQVLGQGAVLVVVEQVAKRPPGLVGGTPAGVGLGPSRLLHVRSLTPRRSEPPRRPPDHRGPGEPSAPTPRPGPEPSPDATRPGRLPGSISGARGGGLEPPIDGPEPPVLPITPPPNGNPHRSDRPRRHQTSSDRRSAVAPASR